MDYLLLVLGVFMIILLMMLIAKSIEIKHLKNQVRNPNLPEKLYEKLQIMEREMRIEFDEELEEINSRFLKKLETTRRQTRAVNFGFASERLAPLRAEHINIKDIRYFGETADFIVFQGLEEGVVEQVIFADAKSSNKVSAILQNKHKWNSRKKYNPATALLSDKQQSIVRAIQEGRVSFEIWMTNEEGDFETYSISPSEPCELLYND